MRQADTLYKLAFSMLRGLNLTTATELLRRIGSAEGFFTADANTLRTQCAVRPEMADDAYRRSLLEAANAELAFANDNNVDFSFSADSDYPWRLRECNDAPAVLYRLGHADLSAPRSIAIVGTRHATAFGCNFVDHLVEIIARQVGQVTIVSGLAYGIDVAAHRAALQHGLPTVAVVAHGLRTIYPADHRGEAARIVKAGGAIVTEYNSNCTPNKGSFLARNRIVAGLADAVIVVESDYRGGAMSTARIASAYNREVFAVPGRPCDSYSRGCNQLIANNTAQILYEPEQLIEAMGWPQRTATGEQQSRLFAEMSPQHRRIIDFLRLHPDATVNELVVALSIPFATLSATLFEMEMADMIISLPGARYGVVK